MAMITDLDYVLQAVRLSTLRSVDDPSTARVISLEPEFGLNPYINATGLSDVDKWPEIKKALDSPPLPPPPFLGERRRDATRTGASTGGGGAGGGLKYSQTIMGPGKSGGFGAGMRVSGRTMTLDDRRRLRNGTGRTYSSGADATPPIPPAPPAPTPALPGPGRGPTMDDGFFSPSRRPRADSAPAPALLPGGGMVGGDMGTSMIVSGRGLGAGSILTMTTPLEQAVSFSETEHDTLDEGLEGEDSEDGEGDETTPVDDDRMQQSTIDDTSTNVDDSGRPSDMGITVDDTPRLGETMVDEGSDLDPDDLEEDGLRKEMGEAERPTDRRHRISRQTFQRHSRPGSSTDHHEPPLDFTPVSISPPLVAGPSGLRAALQKHVPHLISTTPGDATPTSTAAPNPFGSLYTSVATLSSGPGLSLELYYPHSKLPTKPIKAQVRKDASVEEVTGYGLYRFWEEGRLPLLSEEQEEVKLSTVGWGLRIVEDDGEVDEDFPPLDRDSQISKFNYGQFAIVPATEAQIKANVAKAPHILRRPSRTIIPNRPPLSKPPSSTATPRPPLGATSSAASLGSPEVGMASTMKGSVGLSSALSKTVLLKVKITASMDEHVITTIQVPSDMYIADLTEVLCRKKRLPGSALDWVLCLADLSLALPLDRTVASLEGKADLALVKKQWAVEHGLRIGDRRGGDPSASIFKRQSEAPTAARLGAGGAVDFSQAYKKYTVLRKMPIGRHERVLAIDGDYIHIMPSESRAFFDSMKTTSFHITLVASCKLTGRAGGFKLTVYRDGAPKRYEFEAENVKIAAEIVNSIRNLMKSYQVDKGTTAAPPRPGPAPRR